MTLKADAAHRHVVTTVPSGHDAPSRASDDSSVQDAGVGGAGGASGTPPPLTLLTLVEREALMERLGDRLGALGRRRGVDPIKVAVILTQARLGVFASGMSGMYEENVRARFARAREAIRDLPVAQPPTDPTGTGGGAGSSGGSGGVGGAEGPA